MTHSTLRSKPVVLRAAFAIALVLALAACGPESVTGADSDLSAMTNGAFDELATYADEDGTVTAPLTIECTGHLEGAPEGVVTFVATTPGGHALDGIAAFPDVCKTPGHKIDVQAYLKIEGIDGEFMPEIAVGALTKYVDRASNEMVVMMVESGTQLVGPEPGTAVAFRDLVTVYSINMEMVMVTSFSSELENAMFSGRLSTESEPVTASDVPALMEFEGIFYATPFGPVALGELLVEIPGYGPLTSRGFMVGDLLY